MPLFLVLLGIGIALVLVRAGQAPRPLQPPILHRGDIVLWPCSDGRRRPHRVTGVDRTADGAAILHLVPLRSRISSP